MNTLTMDLLGTGELKAKRTRTRKTTTFTKGSGAYACRSCERNTRDDGNGDSVGTGLCTQCFDLAGIQNAMQDGEALTEADRSTIAAHTATISERGGKDVWTAVFAEAVVTPEPVAPAPAPVADAKAERAAAAAAKREAKETEKARKLAAQQEAREAREAVARVKAAAKVKPTHYLGRLAEQNGVKAPQREGSIATAWALFDSATDTIYSAHLPQLAELHGANLGNLQIELNRWRRFNGIAAPGRMPKPEAAAE